MPKIVRAMTAAAAVAAIGVGAHLYRTHATPIPSAEAKTASDYRARTTGENQITINGEHYCAGAVERQGRDFIIWKARAGACK